VTKTQFVEYEGRGFWAYDVGLGVFLKHLIDAAEASGQAADPWLEETVAWWRVVACVSDYGLDLGPPTDAQRQLLIALKLAKRPSIGADEIASWDASDGLKIFTRGAAEVETGPVIELGQAIAQLLAGTLTEAPPNTWWFYGTPEGRDIIHAWTE
jgi:hypothetical protein